MNIISFGLAPINGDILNGTIKEIVQQVWNNGMMNETMNWVEGAIVSVFTALINKSYANLKD